MILVATLIHTGTHSFLRSLEPREKQHFHFTYDSEGLAARYRKADEVYVTYRDPYHVAISWANRRMREISNPRGRNGWYNQWEAWAKFVALEKTVVVPVTTLKDRLHSKPDTHKLYPILEAGDMEQYFNCIPEKAVNFALEKVESVKHLIPEV